MSSAGMKRRSTSIAALALAAILATAGCSSSSNTVTVHESTRITKGRELTDLRRALDAKAVTPDEYERLRRVILERPQ